MSNYDFYGRLFIVVIVVQLLLISFQLKKDIEYIKTQQYFQKVLLEKLIGENE